MKDAVSPSEYMPIIPPPLKKGDTIGLFAPSGPIPEEKIVYRGVEILENSGYKVLYDKAIFQRANYLAGSDKRRADEFMWLYRHNEVKALLAVRGGYGSSRILGDFDFELLSSQPKRIIGFSDLTFLLNGIHALTSMVTYHGPMLSTVVRDDSLAIHPLLNALSGNGKNEIQSKNLAILRKGSCTGKLMGGNLTTLVHMLATPYEPDWQNTILVIEDVNEPAYKVDRMLTHLSLAKRLHQVNGIIIGKFLDSSMNITDDIELIQQRVMELTKEHIPVWGNFDIGHGPDNISLPLGTLAEMDSDNGILSFEL